MRRVRSVRKLIRKLRALGCRPARTKGSHQIWLTPGGRHMTVVVNHESADVTPAVLTSVRRVLCREGLLLEARGEAAPTEPHSVRLTSLDPEPA